MCKQLITAALSQSARAITWAGKVGEFPKGKFLNGGCD
jgi:hypothetical protein